MQCQETERLLLRDFDGLLTDQQKNRLEIHLGGCPACRLRQKEYGAILRALKPEPSEIFPNFWERLQPKLKEREKAAPWAVIRAWSLRAVPLSLVVILLILVTMIFVLPSREKELSQTEALLLRNENPYLDTKALFEESRLENKNMMLIFTAADEQSPSRR
jgi:anti-sigma factor RsiW